MAQLILAQLIWAANSMLGKFSSIIFLSTFLLLLANEPISAVLAEPTPAIHAEQANTVSVQIEQAWVRLMPPVSRNTAAYLTIKNLSKQPEKLLSVSSPQAGMVMIHETKTQANGQVGMRHIDTVEIGPAEYFELKPGAVHIMIMGLKKPTKLGESLELTLNFAKAGSITVMAPILEQME